MFEPVIGLEIHLQLGTESKMFSGASNEIWEARPNTQTTPVELGLPGALPIPNKRAIQMTQKLGKIFGCELARKSKFDRKNYFYPDLPKGYQISQYDQPLCKNGRLKVRDPVTGELGEVRVRRIHLEEDTAKSIHKGKKTYLDHNKSGVPLVELVTEPDLMSAKQAVEFAKMFQAAARTLGVSQAKMQKGQLRLEANVSIRKQGSKKLPDYRVELKNINSFKYLRDAINYEIKRQSRVYKNGQTPKQETRGWNEKQGVSVIQRRKEAVQDYRYFPEPDIPKLSFSEEYFKTLLSDIPEMPWELQERLESDGIRTDYAKILAYDKQKYTVFKNLEPSEHHTTNDLAAIVVNTASEKAAKKQIRLEIRQKKRPDLPEKKLKQLIDQTINNNPQAVKDYQSGRQNAIKYFVGQVMRNSKGQANPQKVKQILRDKLAGNSKD